MFFRCRSELRSRYCAKILTYVNENQDRNRKLNSPEMGPRKLRDIQCEFLLKFENNAGKNRNFLFFFFAKKVDKNWHFMDNSYPIGSTTASRDLTKVPKMQNGPIVLNIAKPILPAHRTDDVRGDAARRCVTYSHTFNLINTNYPPPSLNLS